MVIYIYNIKQRKVDSWWKWKKALSKDVELDEQSRYGECILDFCGAHARNSTSNPFCWTWTRIWKFYLQVLFLFQIQAFISRFITPMKRLLRLMAAVCFGIQDYNTNKRPITDNQQAIDGETACLILL